MKVISHIVIRPIPVEDEWHGQVRIKRTVIAVTYYDDGMWAHRRKFETHKEALEHARTLRLGAQLMGIH